MARDIVVDRGDLPVEDRIGLAVVHALRQHCVVRGTDDDGAERIERLALAAAIASRIAASCAVSGRASRSTVGAGAEVAASPPTHAAAPVGLANARRNSILFVLLHDKDQHGQDRQIKAKGGLLAVPLR